MVHSEMNYLIITDYRGRRGRRDAVVKNPPANAGDTGSSPGLEIGRAHV